LNHVPLLHEVVIVLRDVVQEPPQTHITPSPWIMQYCILALDCGYAILHTFIR
jgi:hypothetical protein